MNRRDLIALVADLDIEMALRSLLTRHVALGTRRIDCRVIRDAMHDPSVVRDCHDTLRPYHGEFSHALVVCDLEGCGMGRLRTEVESQTEQKLASNGWGSSAACVVIEPEVEAWVWSSSPEVELVLGWRGRDPGLREWLVARGYLSDVRQAKPSRPKEAMEAALREARKPRSAAMYGEIGSRVSLARCSDPSFTKLADTLREWFPIGDS